MGEAWVVTELLRSDRQKAKTQLAATTSLMSSQSCAQ